MEELPFEEVLLVCFDTSEAFFGKFGIDQKMLFVI